jgi:hypothetical protein
MSGFFLKKLPFEPEPDNLTSLNDENILATLRINTKWRTAMLDILVPSPDVNVGALKAKIGNGARLSRSSTNAMRVHLQMVAPSQSDPASFAALLNVSLVYASPDKTNFLFDYPDVFASKPVFAYCSRFILKLVSDLSPLEWKVFQDTVAMYNLCSRLTESSLQKSEYLFACFDRAFRAEEVCAVILAGVSTNKNNCLALDVICSRRRGAGKLLFDKVYEFAKQQRFSSITIVAANPRTEELYTAVYGFAKIAGQDQMVKQVLENADMPMATAEAGWRDAFPPAQVDSTAMRHVVKKALPENTAMFAVEDRVRVLVCGIPTRLGETEVAFVFCFLKAASGRVGGNIVQLLTHAAESFGLSRFKSSADVVVSVTFPSSVVTNRTDVWENIGYTHACSEYPAIKLKINTTGQPLQAGFIVELCRRAQQEVQEPFVPPQEDMAMDMGIDADLDEREGEVEGVPQAGGEEEEHKEACANGEPWDPATVPLQEGEFRELYLEELTALDAAADNQDEPLNTAAHRLAMIKGVRGLALTRAAVLGFLRAWLGFAPVSETVKYASPGGDILDDENAYFGQLLTWGQEHRSAFKRVLKGLFDLKLDSGKELDTRKAAITANNCLEPVNIPWMCAQYRRRHQRGFENYWTNHSTPRRFDIVYWYMPKYNVYKCQFIGGILPARLKFMQNAWNRKLRQETFVDACVFFAMDLEQSRLRLHQQDDDAAARLLQQVEAFPGVNENRVLRYLLQNDASPAVMLLQPQDVLPQVPRSRDCAPDESWYRNQDDPAVQHAMAAVLALTDVELVSDTAKAAWLAFQARTLTANVLNAALETAGMNVLQFANQVPRFLALQPVQSNAPKVLPQSENAADLTDNGYLARFIAWGSLGDNLNGTKLCFFGILGTDIWRERIEAILASWRNTNCREAVNMHGLAAATFSKRKMTKTFSNKYHNRSVFADAGPDAAVDLFSLNLPKFDISRVPDANELPESRRLAMERGWRLKRLHDYACAYALYYLEEVFKARDVVTANMETLPELDRAGIRQMFTPPDEEDADFTSTLYTLFQPATPFL